MNKTKYLQGDGRWGGLPYPKKPCYIRAVGCGEVSIANVLIEMEQYKNYTPATIQPYCKQFGAPNCDGTYLSGICKMMKHYGLTNVKECATMPELWKELEKGNRVAIYLMGSRKGGSKKIHWTSGGHFVASVDYKYEDKKHKVYMKDPWTNDKNRNGWITYEENMKGDVVAVYVGKLVGEKASTPSTKSKKLSVDGIGGKATIRATQKFFGTAQDGIISDQIKKLYSYYPSITAVEFGKGKSGSAVVKALQKWLGITPDGLIGKGTTAAWQKRLRDLGYLAKNEKIDGLFGVKSMKAWQRFLNDQLFKEEEKPKDPEPTPPPAPEKKHYEGEYPNPSIEKTVTHPNSDKLLAKAKSLCGKASSATDKFKTALNEAYPNRSSWGSAAKAGRSCDVFVGVLVRILGWDKNYPRGLAEQYFYKPDGFTRKVYKDVSPYDVSKSGDIVIYSKKKTPTSKNKGKGVTGHTCVRGDGVLYEANHPSKYPHVNKDVKGKLDTKRPYVIVLTPKGTYKTTEKRDYLKEGDTGAEVTKLQNYLNWYFNGEFFKACGNADGIFGKNTNEWVKKMQTQMFGADEANGLVGAKTIAEMQKAERIPTTE